MNYNVGLDIGSTTIKCVVADEKNQIVFRSYERHYAKVNEKEVGLIETIEDVYKRQPAEDLL